MKRSDAMGIVIMNRSLTYIKAKFKESMQSVILDEEWIAIEGE
jgi:hypothetical protein